MKALRELGIKKTIRFIFATLFLGLFRLSLFPPVRSLLLVLVGAHVGGETIIHRISLFNFYHQGFKTLSIGSQCFLGDDVMLDLAQNIALEDHVTLSNRVLILTHTNVGYENHPLQKYYPRMEKGVICRKGCFIGAGAIIMPGVVIGEGAVVGAGAVVTKSVPAWTVVVGVPAKKIRKLQ